MTQHRLQHTSSTASSQDRQSPAPNQFPAHSQFAISRRMLLYSTLYLQLQVNQWIKSQLPSHLPPNRPLASTPPISLDHRLQVHLQTRSITASQCISEFPITASKCLSKLVRLRPPSSHDHGLQLHLRTRSITASKCISKLGRSRPPSSSLNFFDHSLQVHCWWARAGVRGNGGGLSDGEYWFGRPWGRLTSPHFHLIRIDPIAWILTAGSYHICSLSS